MTGLHQSLMILVGFLLVAPIYLRDLLRKRMERSNLVTRNNEALYLFPYVQLQQNNEALGIQGAQIGDCLQLCQTARGM